MSWGEMLAKPIALAVVCLVVVSCVTKTDQPEPIMPGSEKVSSETAQESALIEPIVPNFVREPAEQIPEEATHSIHKGSGTFIGSGAKKSRKQFAKGKITLNFKAANLSEFVSVVFDKILEKNYLLDPRINGKVTLHTTYPVRDDAILPILESVLQQNGAAMVLQQGIYKIVPLEDAPGLVDSPRVGSRLAPDGAYGIQIVPLRYVSAKEIEKVITPMLPRGGQIRVDDARNLLILTASRYRLEQMLETIRIFDVDWFKGMSFGLFRLQYAEAATLVNELSSLMGSDGRSPLAGIVRLVPIERLNAVLVVSHAPQYLDKVHELIGQFDWGVEGTPGQRLFVYRLKNSKADKLATVLQQIYETDEADQDRPVSATVSQLPPGERSNFTAAAPASPATGNVARADAAETATTTRSGAKTPAQSDALLQAGSVGENTDLSTQTSVKIIAEPDSNSLLVMASPQDYRGIETVIKQLDLPPRQVLIEANIAEVTLSDSLAYGVRWFLRRNASQLGLNAPVPEAAGGDGLTLSSFSGVEQVRSFVDLLASKTAVNFLSVPHIVVLDNQTASIRVGDQIPVTVRNAQSTGEGDSPIVSEVQFRDTGTLLTVTPRINAGGQITLEISQEVSLPGSEPSVGGGGNVAISQRTIDSSVVVQSGETVLLGGLILETKNESRSGIPMLMDIPILGNLFSSTSDVVFRTELIVMITPKVIESEAAMRAVIDEVRGKMKRAVDFGNSVESVEM